MYTFKNRKQTVSYDPSTCSFVVEIDGERWQWVTRPVIERNHRPALRLTDALCKHSRVETGIAEGVQAEYRFREPGEPAEIAAFTEILVDKTDGRIHCTIRIEYDDPLEVSEVRFPGAFSLDAEAGAGYTVFPVGQGAVIPAKDSKPIDGIGGDMVYSRSMYMPFFGQVRNGTGYCAIYETPYDAKHYLHHVAFGDTTVQPIFVPSLGTMAYKREMIYDFFQECSYVSIAKHYRGYVAKKGNLITLREKAARNPNVSRLFGAPTIRRTAKTHIAEGTKFYNSDDLTQNDSCTTFDELAEDLTELHRRGLRDAYFHLGGWCALGYDNRHPDPFPIAPDAGGTEGLQRLAETCRKLGFLFGVHDQYRDYYYDAESFSFENAVAEADGIHPYCDTWHGGQHTYLCTQLAPDYVKRNYNTFEDLGVPIDGVYLDVFSVVELDECSNPNHRMTREQCAAKRRECFELLNARGQITSSEEVIDCIIPALPMTDHATYLVVPAKEGEEPGRFSEPKGIPVPLFNLVYHDCIITPWRSCDKPNDSHYGVPKGDSYFLHGVLNGGTMFVDDEDDFEAGPAGSGPTPSVDDAAGGDASHCGAAVRTLAPRIPEALELFRRVATQEMTSHEFLDDGYRRQRTTFADGTTVEVDFEAGTYVIGYPEEGS